MDGEDAGSGVGVTGVPCADCGEMIHPYEAGVSVTEDNGWRCGSCTRKLDRRRGKDTRSIQRHHKWAPGTDPSDDDAHPDSDWRYVTPIPASEEPEPDQRDMLSGGPESGVKCFRCGEMTRVGGESTPKAILGNAYAVEGAAIEKQMALETIVILVCPRCYNKQQWRRSHLEKIRQQKLEVV